MAASSSVMNRATVSKGRKGASKKQSSKMAYKKRKGVKRKFELSKTKFKDCKRKKRIKEYNSDDEEQEISQDPEECITKEQVRAENDDDDDIEEQIQTDHCLEAREEGDDENSERTRSQGNEGWADVMTKILTRHLDTKKTAILAKGRTDQEIATKKELEKTREQDFEIDGGQANPVLVDSGKTLNERRKTVKQMKREVRTKQLEKKSWENMGRVKPNVLNREKERALQRIATTGVVQLFNAVNRRQKTMTTKMNEVGGSEVKREKVMKSMTKGEFLDVLKKKAKSIPLEEATVSVKQEITKPDSGRKPTWSVFSDEFMMGAKMKDWDKESDSNSDIWENSAMAKKKSSSASESSSDES